MLSLNYENEFVHYLQNKTERTFVFSSEVVLTAAGEIEIKKGNLDDDATTEGRNVYRLGRRAVTFPYHSLRHVVECDSVLLWKDTIFMSKRVRAWRWIWFSTKQAETYLFLGLGELLIPST